MSALRLRQREDAIPMPASGPKSTSDRRLAGLSRLAGVDIETPLVDSLSRDLHAVFDHVSEDALPIYFGPLLGRLYLEGL